AGVAEGGVDGGKGVGRDGVNHRRLFGEDGLDLIKGFFARGGVERLHVRVEKLVNARLPLGGGRFLRGKPLAHRVAGAQDVQAGGGVKSAAAEAEQGTFVVVGGVDLLSQHAKGHQFKIQLHANLAEVVHDECADGH